MLRVLRDPLAWFAAAAAGAFLLFAVLGDETSDPKPQITITAADIQRLVESFELVWMRGPTEEEIEDLIEERVRDEILYREAVAMGLDRDDTLVRRRMRQGLELMASEIGTAAEPTEKELEEHLRENSDRYRSEPLVSFRQIYLSPEKRGSAVVSDASKLLGALEAGSDAISLAEPGDATLLPAEEVDARVSLVAGQFGKEFADALATAPEDEWFGPLESPYGVHLVRVEERKEGGLPPLAEVRDAVLRDLQMTRADRAEAEFFASLLERYTIVVEPLFEEEEAASR
ncbi:MAG: peptidyl-prolyl cis-trans isomerase [Vicinamibacteria bacterium]